MRPLRMLASIFINQSENTKVTHSHNNYAISEKSYDRMYCEILPIKFGMIYLFGWCNITKLRNYLSMRPFQGVKTFRQIW